MGSFPKADKGLGQHFLIDQKVISVITSTYANSCDVIIEVGAGPAVLTRHLAKYQKDLYVIEADLRFEDTLLEFVKKENLFIDDALKFNWQSFLEKNNLINKKIWLISNLPYNVSVPLTMSFIKVNPIEYMTLMYQKEVGEKIIERDNQKNSMGSLKSICQNFFQTSQLSVVHPGAFSPPPKVESIVINFQRISQPAFDLSLFESFEKFLRSLFMFKRKQIHHGLRNLVNKKDIDEKILKSVCEKTIRAEALNLKQVFSLFENYRNYIK